jgi:hypothetical protein
MDPSLPYALYSRKIFILCYENNWRLKIFKMHRAYMGLPCNVSFFSRFGDNQNRIKGNGEHDVFPISDLFPSVIYRRQHVLISVLIR